MKCIPHALFLFSLSLCLPAEAADPLIVAQGLPGRLPGTLPGQQPPATPQPAAAPTPAAGPGMPAACCDITAIDKASSVVSARERASGRIVEFKVGNAALLQKMQVGQAVHANFSTMQASIDGKTMCCTITSVAAPTTTASKTPAQPLAGQKAPQPSPAQQPPKTAAAGSAKPMGAPQGLPGQKLAGQTSAGASAQPANAQPPLSSQAATTQVNPEVIALMTSSDLVARDLGFTGEGKITFNLVNRGEVGINVQNMPGGATKVKQAPSSGPPISIDIHIGTTKITLQQASMGGKQTKNFIVPVADNSKPKCLETRNLKVVIDPQNLIKELHDDNNVIEASSARPCPDLAIKSIKRDYEGLLNETYRVKVTVVNQGNAPSPANTVWATSLPGGVWPVTGWPELVPTTTLKALAPGEDTSFKVGGSVVSANKTAVRIVLDRDRKVEESDETNNFKDDRL